MICYSIKLCKCILHMYNVIFPIDVTIHTSINAVSFFWWGRRDILIFYDTFTSPLSEIKNNNLTYTVQKKSSPLLVFTISLCSSAWFKNVFFRFVIWSLYKFLVQNIVYQGVKCIHGNFCCDWIGLSGLIYDEIGGTLSAILRLMANGVSNICSK